MDKKMNFKLIILIIGLLGLTGGCGVKGKPLPPKTPREIGIGKPVYKGVDQEMNESKKKNKAKK